MKTLTKLLIPFIAGSLVLGGCGNKELEEYNKKNQQVYKDATQFVIEGAKIRVMRKKYLFYIKYLILIQQKNYQLSLRIIKIYN
ncbi:MAG: hypothetical protein AABY06_00575 [Nanoarchaeota archaeon]